MKTKTYQQGFGVLAVILALVLIIAVAGTGWMVWRSRYQSRQAIPNTSQGVANSETIAQQPNQTAQIQQLEITEWGVKMDVIGLSGKPTYKITTNSIYGGSNAFLSTSRLDSSLACQKYYGPSTLSFQNIQRFTADEQIPVNGGYTLVSFEEAAKSNPQEFKVIDGYGYLFRHGNGMPCDDDKDNATFNVFNTSFDSLQSNK
ncbi:MAG: hypothetical protein V4702_05825 [Patescibacteria group bacterium]